MEPRSKPSFKDLVEVEIARRARRLALFYHDEDGKERTAEISQAMVSAERKLCKDDPIYWIRNHGWLHDPHADDPDLTTIPFLLWPKQVEIALFLLAGLEQKRNRHLNKARSIGVTWLALHLIVHRWLFFTGFMAKVGSRKEDLVDDKTMDSLFGKIRFIINRQPRFLRPPAQAIDDKEMVLTNQALNSEILGEATNPGFGRGGRRAVVLLDEFAHVDPGIQNSMWVSLSTVQRSIWDISTPNGRGNRFHWNCTHSSAEDVMVADYTTNPNHDSTWYASLLTENGGSLTWDEREQEHGCNFSAITGLRVFRFKRDSVVVPYDYIPQIEGAMTTLPVVVGLDFGSGAANTVGVEAVIDFKGGDDLRPRIAIFGCVVGERRAAYDVARDILFECQDYRGRMFAVGDPSGSNPDPGQESYESHMRSAGLPLVCLDRWYNDPMAIRETIGEVNRMMEDRGAADTPLLIVSESCPDLIEALDGWSYSIPKGSTLETVGKDVLPKKDMYSHCGDALRYLVGFVLRGMRRSKSGVVEVLATQLRREKTEEPRQILTLRSGAAGQIAAALRTSLRVGIGPRRKIGL